MDSFWTIIQRHAFALEGEFKDPLVFNVGVGLVFILGATLMAKMSAFSYVGGSAYARRQTLKFVGGIMVAFAVWCWGVAYFSDTFLTNKIDSEAIMLGTQPTPPSAPAAAPSSPIHRPVLPQFRFSTDIPAHEPEVPPDQQPTAATAPVAAPNPSSTAAIAPSKPVEPSSNYSLSGNSGPASLTEEGLRLIQQASHLNEQKQWDAAIAVVNQEIGAEPRNVTAYILRGNIYAEKKAWDQAKEDYQTALQLDDKNFEVKFNLAEILFMQKNYDQARPGFAALEQDFDKGDLASYKVFLCDLFAGHEATSAQELDAFNKVGSNASYYFANAAWSLYHQKREDARGWLLAATGIYGPAEVQALRDQPDRTWVPAFTCAAQGQTHQCSPISSHTTATKKSRAQNSA